MALSQVSELLPCAYLYIYTYIYYCIHTHFHFDLFAVGIWPIEEKPTRNVDPVGGSWSKDGKWCRQTLGFFFINFMKKGRACHSIYYDHLWYIIQPAEMSSRYFPQAFNVPRLRTSPIHRHWGSTQQRCCWSHDPWAQAHKWPPGQKWVRNISEAASKKIDKSCTTMWLGFYTYIFLGVATTTNPT